MLIPRATKRVHAFNMDDSDDRISYEAVLNDPRNRIISRKWVTQSETNTVGEDTTTTSQQFIYLEVEVCGL